MISLEAINNKHHEDDDDDDDDDESQDIEEGADAADAGDLHNPENDENGGDNSDDHQSQMTASDEEATWIQWFVNIRGNDFYCEVDESFVQDDFNLTGLSIVVPYYDYALDIILDIDIPLDVLTEDQHEMVETAAEVLYGLIHARYILTTAGMNKMYQKYQNVNFGRCPRSLCQGQPVLPVGLSDVAREYSVEVFCPKCQETYHPRSSKHANLDGAYFGTTFCHLFLLTHTELIIPPTVEKYVPRIFGFRINESSLYYRLRNLELTSAQPPHYHQSQAQKKKPSPSRSGLAIAANVANSLAMNTNGSSPSPNSRAAW